MPYNYALVANHPDQWSRLSPFIRSYDLWQELEEYVAYDDWLDLEEIYQAFGIYQYFDKNGDPAMLDDNGHPMEPNGQPFTGELDWREGPKYDAGRGVQIALAFLNSRPSRHEPQEGFFDPDHKLLMAYILKENVWIDDDLYRATPKVIKQWADEHGTPIEEFKI